MLERPPAEEKAEIDAAIEKSIALLPQLLGGDMQGAMNKLHTDDKPPVEKKAEPVSEPAKKEGLLSGLFGRKK